tara:strand:- start:1186 stop:1866 length:681 start_codon:yes stop_codon:yes gene_type:complete
MVPLKGYESLYSIERNGRIWTHRTNKYLKANKEGKVTLKGLDNIKQRHKVRYLVDCQFTIGYLESLGVPVKGYEDLYSINEQGQIWSCTEKMYKKLCKNRTGYLYTELYKYGVAKTCELHRLLALQFIPNPTGRPEVDHINQDKSDNRLENLRWATKDEQSWNRGMTILNKSGYIGVYWNKQRKRWTAELRAYKKRYSKQFVLLEDAIAHRNWLVDTYHIFGLTVE